jgi:hypothetical protein
LCVCLHLCLEVASEIEKEAKRRSVQPITDDQGEEIERGFGTVGDDDAFERSDEEKPSKKKSKKEDKKKRSKKATKRKRGQDDEEEVEDINAREDQADHVRGNNAGMNSEVQLTEAQEEMRRVLTGELSPFIIGRIHVDPAKLRSPPPQYAARRLYEHHMANLRIHFITGGMLAAVKDLILFMQFVSLLFAALPYQFIIGFQKRFYKVAYCCGCSGSTKSQPECGAIENISSSCR